MAQRLRIDFPNQNGESLAAMLELPAIGNPRAFILFAHCFTCGKDIRAATRISRAFVANGYAVLRFDFTGLGGSEGDFANTNFSSNIADLVSATEYLRNNYQAPQILIGHSLGGTAIIAAAEQIPEANTVVTIGSPAKPEHLMKTLGLEGGEITEDVIVQIASHSLSTI